MTGVVLIDLLAPAMTKKRLLTPGPTQVPEAARLAMAREVIHHRTPEFRALFAEALVGLKYVFQTENDVLVLTSSGSGAMEAAVVNTVPRGGKAIVLESGVFSRRWADICTRYGIEVVRHAVEWGQPVTAADVERMLAEHPDAVAVFGTLMESSTGVGHDVRAIGEVVARSKALWIVDGISGVGAMECRTDLWHIDLLVVGSQKALMTPPGLAFVSVSDRGWRQIDTVQPQAFYFDLKIHRQKIHGSKGADTPWTPAHTLVAGLAESLKLIRPRGSKPSGRGRAGLSRATIAGMARHGPGSVCRPAGRGDDGRAISCGSRRPGDAQAARKPFWHQAGRRPVGLEGKIFRLAHFGLIDELDIIATLAAIELVLDELGYPVKLGAAAAAASEVFRSPPANKS